MTVDPQDKSGVPIGAKGKDPFEMHVRGILFAQKHNGTLLNGQPTYNVDADWTDIPELQNTPCYFIARGGRQVKDGNHIKGVSRGMITLLRPAPAWSRLTPKMRLKMRDTGRELWDEVIYRNFEIEAVYASRAVIFKKDVKTLVIKTLETR